MTDSIQRSVQQLIDMIKSHRGLATVQYIRKHSHLLNGNTKTTWSPLMHAVFESNFGYTKVLIDEKADIQYRDESGLTPLHLACWIGNKRIVKHLIRQGADVNTKDNYGRTPLMLAVKKGYRGTAQWLLSKGADTNLRDVISRDYIHYMAWGGNPKLIRQILSDHSIDINRPDDNGWTPVMFAVSAKNSSAVQQLHQKGADMTHYNKDGWSLPMIAASNSTPGILSYVLEQGIAPDETRAVQEFTALMVAIAENKKRIAEILLNTGADVNKTSSTDQISPLMFAIAEGRLGMVCLLLDHGAQVNHKAKITRTTPLMIAVEQGNAQIVKLLIERGADLNIRNRFGYTPYMMAVMKKHKRLLPILTNQAELN